MPFRWDWLRPVVTVPFVPTIGPVHPEVLAESVFTDILNVATTGRFLPYDKDIRWFAAKDEAVLADAVVHEPDGTLIPTLSRRGSGRIKVHVYDSRTDALATAAERARALRTREGADAAAVVRFLGPDAPNGRGTQIHLKDFTATECPRPGGPVRCLDRASNADERSFAAFAHEIGADGFAFLYERMQRGDVGDILVAVVDDQVVGAIGPLEIRPDAAGTAQLMPQSFGVLAAKRGMGLGRLLWRAAMHWGQSHGAGYQLLQTVVGSASDHLCRTEGLRLSLGFVDSQFV